MSVLSGSLKSTLNVQYFGPAGGVVRDCTAHLGCDRTDSRFAAHLKGDVRTIPSLLIERIQQWHSYRRQSKRFAAIDGILCNLT